MEQLAEQKPGQFDIVTCMELLEHVPDPSAIVACATLAKPGGHVFFSTINRNPKSYLMAIVGAEYVMKLVPKGTHEYLKFIKPSELSGWARASDLSVKSIHGMIVNPITMEFKISNDVGVNYFLHCIK